MDNRERLDEICDVVLSEIIKDDDESRNKRRLAFSELSPEMFTDENFIIYTLFFKFKSQGLTPDAKFMQLYLQRNKKIILDNERHLSMDKIDDKGADKALAYSALVLKHFNSLLKYDTHSLEDFKREIETLKTLWADVEIQQAYNDAKVVLVDGKEVGRRTYQGFEDSVAMVKNASARIQSILDKSTGAGFISSRTTSLHDTGVVKPEKIGDFGLINELNEKLDGYYTSYFYSVMAPTKGGKSKWCSRACHNISVEHGNNVTVWAHEGGYQAWMAQMIAIHYEYLYGRKNEGKYYRLSQREVLNDKYPSDEVKILARDAELDLQNNKQYGEIYYIDRPFKVETLIEEIETAVQLNHSKAVIIDYLQLIGWDTKGLSKPQAIGKAYQELLAFGRKHNVLIMSPAQMTQDFMNEMAKAKDGKVSDIRTAGGESSEVVRTPDINIALYSDDEDRSHHEMRILSMPSRFAESFAPIRIKADLASCLFSSIVQNP